MYEQIANAFVIAFEAYVLVGALFAIAFVAVGVSRIDPAARGAGVAFRIAILPGSAAFWPLLLSRWVRGVHEPPLERNPHR